MRNNIALQRQEKPQAINPPTPASSIGANIVVAVQNINTRM